jgi:hypothetical protein
MYASNTHTTSKSEAHYPGITRSNNKQRTNRKRELLRKRKTMTVMIMSSGSPGKKSVEAVSKEQAPEP